MFQAVSNVAVGHILSVARSSAAGDNSHMQRRGNVWIVDSGTSYNFPDSFTGGYFWRGHTLACQDLQAVHILHTLNVIRREASAMRPLATRLPDY